MHGYHVYKDILELPCSPEQIFAKIVMPRGKNISKGAIPDMDSYEAPSVVSKR